MLITSVWQLNKIDAVSVDDAFFGAHGQTAKLVLITREHKCRWTEALLVQSKGGQQVWVVKIVSSRALDPGLEEPGSCCTGRFE